MDAAQLDYELRLQEARMKGRQQPPEQFLRWLHPPKTGTSFVNTMVRWGCPNIPDNTFVVPVADTPTDLGSDFNGTISWDWLFSKESGREWLKENCNRRLVTLDPNTLMPHYSLWAHRALIAWEIPNTVVIFRLPLQRTYSNYLHLAHHFNESKTPRRSLLQFAKLPKYMSQQAKLVLGRTYDDTNIVSALDANRAADIVAHGFKFVGLTEEYELSIRLFHAKFGGVPHDAEFENTRPGIKRYRDTTARSRTFRYNESDFRGWTDTSDDIVYQAARKRFWRDVRALKDEIEVDGLGPVTVKTEHMQ